MSQTAFAVDDRPAALPLEALVDTLAALGVSFRRKGEDLALRNAGLLTDELRVSVTEHKADLLDLADVGAELSSSVSRLHDMITRLRCENPKRGTRAKALSSVAANIEKLADRALAAGLAVGVLDSEGNPETVMGLKIMGDPFGGDEFRALRLDLADLTRADAPYPLGALTDDPFSMQPPRFFSGKLIAETLTTR